MITAESIEMLSPDELRIIKVALPIYVVKKLVEWEKARLNQQQDSIGAYDQDDQEVIRRTRQIFVEKTTLDSILHFFSNLPDPEEDIQDGTIS